MKKFILLAAALALTQGQDFESEEEFDVDNIVWPEEDDEHKSDNWMPY